MFMRFLVFLVLLNVTIQAPSKNEGKIDYRKEFESFVQKFNRTYKTSAERSHRYEIFIQNMNKMLAHSKSIKTAKFGVTQFADWTDAEKAQFTSLKRPSNHTGLSKSKSSKVMPGAPYYNLPTNFDWRSKNVVTPVKNQGQCGGCWTFQTTALVESYVLLKGYAKVNLSEQQLVDCDQIDGSNGCSGGWPNAGLEYAREYGLLSEQTYPYRGYNGQCYDSYYQNGRTYIQSWEFLGADEQAAAYKLTQLGPLGYNIWVPDSLYNYQSGVWWPSQQDCQLAQQQGAGHAVTIVGFGSENGVPYWLIKNSWGTWWGERGYFKIHRASLTCAMGYGIGDYNGEFGNGDEYFVAITN